MYADYDFYLNEYFGDAISPEDFPRLSERASDYVRAATRRISDTVDSWQLEAVKKCACAVADVLLDESIMTANVYSGEQAVSSETVGGWSRSYKAPSVSSAEAAFHADRKRDALLLYLGNLPAFAPVFRVRSYRCTHRAE
ncbi:MAG: hypothetical protein HFF66_00805 [Oscillospiraceae bacterium]|jgi:hypothetical protein|nr:hypothetical protein [Oscillospiraceae bacterium]